MSLLSYLGVGLLLLIWIIAGGYITHASTNLTSYRNDNNDLNNAYWYAFWGAFITWFLVGGAILVIILAIVGVVALFATGVGEVGVAAGGAAEAGVAAEGAVEAEEAFSVQDYFTKKATDIAKQQYETKKEEAKKSSFWPTLFGLGAVILLFITGLFAVLTATNIKSNPEPVTGTLSDAYYEAIVSASLSLGSVGLLLLGFIIHEVWRNQQARRQEKARMSA